MDSILRRYYITSDLSHQNDENIYSLSSFTSYIKAEQYIEDLRESKTTPQLERRFGKWVGIQVVKQNFITGEKSTGVLDKFYL